MGALDEEIMIVVLITRWGQLINMAICTRGYIRSSTNSEPIIGTLQEIADLVVMVVGLLL